MKRLKEAHDAELHEAGVTPGLLINPDKLNAALSEYRKLKDSKDFYDGLHAALKAGGFPRGAVANLGVAAMIAEKRLDGAAHILNALGIQTEKGVTDNEHS